MGKILRFIISFICAAIAFLIGTAIVGALSLATLTAFIIPVVLAVIVFSIVQLFLGIFKIKNLIFFGILIAVMNGLGISFFNIFS